MISLSKAIEARRREYYEALQSAQRSLETTAWVRWFVGIALEAQQDAEERIRFVLRKFRFFQRFERDLNERQLKVIRRMFEAGPDGFAGGMNARKYIALTSVSKATATRDLQYLAELGALTPTGGGRSTRYELGKV